MCDEMEREKMKMINDDEMEKMRRKIIRIVWIIAMSMFQMKIHLFRVPKGVPSFEPREISSSQKWKIKSKSKM